MSDRKRKKGKRGGEAKRESEARRGEGGRWVSYDITEEPLEDLEYPLPAEVDEQYAKLHDMVLGGQAGAAAAVLEELRGRFPKVPQLDNLLINAYLMLGRDKEAGALIEDSYRRFPDYLFVRVQYATQLLNQGKLDEVAGVFGGNFDLSMVYPGRKVFHITEVMAFMGLMAMYFWRKGEGEVAGRYHKIMKQLRPEDSATRAVGRQLELGRVLSTVEQMLRRMRERRR